MKKRTLTVLFAVANLSAILLAACAPAALSTEERGLYPEGEAVGAPSFAEEPAAGFAGELDAGGVVANDAVADQAAERLVIKNASLSIVVDDPEQRMKEIGDMAERMGGFVVSSNLYKTSLANGTEVPAAYITVRVPADDFLAALEEIREGAIDVPNDNQSGQDVTAEYTDLQSRLRNLENAADLLRQIMEEARDTEDVLNAFNQLNSITEQIEVLKGQIKYYEESAALSAISVDIIANEAVQPIKVGPWDITGVAKEAIEALVKALQGIAEALVWLALYVLPIVLIIGIPAWLIFRGLRGWYDRRTPPKRSR
ncbi:MAG TPA: DUF4349 domain-containing protein [Anaerolineales bacterium]|nr:DUF4349 domain-containing protein [Anaerolineales bacterium]